MRANRKEWWAITALAAYDFWLLAFPLQGYFLLHMGKSQSFSWFVAPHTLGLFLCAWLGHKIDFRRISMGAGIATSLLTITYPFLPNLEKLLLPFIGFFSALLIVRIGCLLSLSQKPATASAAGLAIGNVLLGISLLVNPPKEILFPLLGILLLAQVPAAFPEQKKEPIKDLIVYLPFIFVFYLLIGTFYVCLMPSYMKFHFFNGSELLFYIAAVLLSAVIFQRKPDLSLVIGVGMGVFAVSFLHDFNHLTSNLAMYAVQASAGFMDVFCFGLFIKGKDVVRRFGLGAGCMLAGPTVGLPVLYSGRWPLILCIGGNIVLGVGLLLFYLVQTIVKEKEKQSITLKQNTEIDDTQLNKACQVLGISKEIFSYREWEILKLALSGKSIREIASLLGLSESSVKTYLQRIYRKLGVSSKKELMRKFMKAPPQP